MKPRISAEEFDRMFDEGEDVTPYLDFDSAIRINQPQQRVNVDFPTWMVLALDREASRLGVTRQSVIKTWIGERLEATNERRVQTESERVALVRERQARYGSKPASEDASRP
jgi:hypothetical protein